MERFSIADLSSIGVLIFISQMLGGIKASLSILLDKRSEMTRSTSLFSTITERMKWTLTHIIIVLTEWQGQSKIFDKSWDDKGADITMFCDIALNRDAPVAGSFGKGIYMLPSGNHAKYEQIDRTRPRGKLSTLRLTWSCPTCFSLYYILPRKNRRLCVYVITRPRLK